MIFLNKTHKYNFKKLSKQINLNMLDNERLAFIYIISGNDDLFKKRNVIYDFSKNVLKFTAFNKSNVDFCSSSKALIRLGANLFNGYSDKYTNPLNLLGILDCDNYILAVNSLELRFLNF